MFGTTFARQQIFRRYRNDMKVLTTNIVTYNKFGCYYDHIRCFTVLFCSINFNYILVIDGLIVLFTYFKLDNIKIFFRPIHVGVVTNNFPLVKKSCFILLNILQQTVDLRNNNDLVSTIFLN